MKRTYSILAFLSLSVLFISVGGGVTGLQKAPQLTSLQQNSSNVKIDGDYGKMPLYFIPNRGQVDAQVAYYLQGKDKTIYFTPQGLTYVLSEGKAGEKAVKKTASAKKRLLVDPADRELPSRKDQSRYTVKLDFVGANSGVRPSGEEKTGAVISYFKGKPEEWEAGLPTYSRIVYKELWPGIDVAYYGTVHKMKYEFVVHPGSDPALIRLAYRGASTVQVNGEGRLEVRTPSGGFEDDRPIGYQEINGDRVDVEMSYVLEEPCVIKPGPGGGKIITQSHIYGFAVGAYDRTQPLVLDPSVLVYCGYIGGRDPDHGTCIAVDSMENAYITGYTYSTEDMFPVIAGPDLTHNGGEDVFVAKVNPSGTALIYCGYIGGSGVDHGWGIAVDASGNAYITGTTSSTEGTFPVIAGPDLTYNGGTDDTFVAKVNPTGTALVYCGYIGGSDAEDIGQDIAVDGSENAYITGSTFSTEASFPVAGGPDLTHNGYRDAFVAKINPSGTALVYCGYIGGANDDWGMGLAVDGSGNAYVGGDTYSTETTFPVIGGPDLTQNGAEDAFVAKVNPSGTGLVYCGFIGGQGRDQGMGLAIDSSGSSYITGPTYSTEATFPVVGGPDLTHNGGRDVYVAKVNPSGTSLVYCGYIGGSHDEDISQDIAVDASENAYVTGYTFSTEATFPVVGGPDLTHNGVMDAFVAKVNSSGTALVYCGYVGGSSYDWGLGIAVDASGNAYITGETYSSQATFPVVGGPDLTHNGGDPIYDAFVAKMPCWDVWAAKHAVGDFDGDGVDEVAEDFGTLGAWMYDNGTWTPLSPANPQSLAAGDVDNNNVDEILADFGSAGLWLWTADAWTQLSGVDVEGLATGDVDADGADEISADFGAAGLWLYNGGAWTILSGINADYITVANADGGGGDEIFGDFGAPGLWGWNTGAWTVLSAVNADYVMTGRQSGTRFIAGDFGSLGLWLWAMPGTCTPLSGLNADYLISANISGGADDGIVGDFGAAGLWLWASGAWTILSGVNAEFMIRADVDGNGTDVIVADFGPIGLWMWKSGAWSQLTGVNPEYMLAGDFDGDKADEIMADFGTAGLWLWNFAAWSQVSTNNPD